MARRGKLINDADSFAMISIKGYAVFIGYLSMAIKGLGFLIITWTTVVLLGGFVSDLQNKDFWCLTFIVLVQTAGIFDVYMNEKLSYILYSAYGLCVGSAFPILADKIQEKAGTVACFVRISLAVISMVLQLLVSAILVCLLAAVYLFGLLVSAAISIWRLIQHDYGDKLNEKANLKPAMDLLYWLALLQGVIFFYRFIFARMGKAIAKDVIPTSEDKGPLEAVLTYLRETRIGCEKNPSFARGRNFITHAVDLIGSKSHDDCLSGIQLLYTAICFGERELKEAEGEKEARWTEIVGQHMLMKNLIMSASSSPILQKVLLQTLNLRDAYDREMRNQAARIVAYLALDIHLEKFPRGIQYISTLIGTFEEYRLMEPYHIDRLIHRYDEDWNRQASLQPSLGPGYDELQEAYKKLVLRGLCILRKLASDENNCRIMSETQDLLPRIMAPLTSDIIHQFNGGAWSISVVEGSLKVMHLLVAAPREAGARMRREISNNKEAVRTMERILNCDYCHVKLQKLVTGILIQLYMDTKSRPAVINKLIDIFVAAGDKTDTSIRKLAGEALAKLCLQSGRNTGIILQVDGDVVGSLTKILLDAENKTCRIRAAEILEHMCNISHTQDDECISELKKSMTTTMPKVLAEILCYELAKDGTHARTEADKLEVLVKEVDIENQYNEDEGEVDVEEDESDDVQLLPVPRGHAQYKSSSSIETDQLEVLVKVGIKNKHKEDTTSSSTHPQYKDDEGDLDLDEDECDNEEDEEHCAPLLSLCVTVCDTFISADQELPSQFDAISLPKKLTEFVQENSIPTERCLRLMKLTCKMVISMMKHRGSYIKEDLDSLMNALSGASESMLHLDISTVFAGQDDGAQTMKPVRSLYSLVMEAKESAAARTCN